MLGNIYENKSIFLDLSALKRSGIRDIVNRVRNKFYLQLLLFLLQQTTLFRTHATYIV